MSPFVYRIGLWVAAQKVGKGPSVAAEMCVDFVGPVLFDGRAEDGERKGRPWATHRIQLAAVVEEQVENTWVRASRLGSVTRLACGLIRTT